MTNHTEEELLELVKQKFETQKMETFEKMIEYLRYKQKQYVEGESDISGVDVMGQMLSDGSIKLDMFLKIWPAVSNYKNPYKITE